MAHAAERNNITVIPYTTATRPSNNSLVYMNHSSPSSNVLKSPHSQRSRTSVRPTVLVHCLRHVPTILQYVTRRRRRPRHTRLAHRRLGVRRSPTAPPSTNQPDGTRPDTPLRTGTPARARGAAQVPLPASRANAEARTHVGLDSSDRGSDRRPPDAQSRAYRVGVSGALCDVGETSELILGQDRSRPPGLIMTD